MKILIVCSGNADNFDFKLHQAFVYEQIESVKKIFKIEYGAFFIKGKGFNGYLKNIFTLRKKIKSFTPEVVHAHFGLSGFVACLQRKVPVVITFHGSDAYFPMVKLISRVAAKLSKFNIFVSEMTKKKIDVNYRYSIIPCGIDFDLFYPVDMTHARKQLNMDQGKKYILFSSGFDNKVKNASLAFSAIAMLNLNSELIELKNRNRDEVNLLLNACNLLLLTSKSEGSPQIIKEAMACNCPIVATDVGDIKEVIGNTEGCYITSLQPEDVAEKIKLALQFNRRTNAQGKIKHLNNNIIAQSIFNVYKSVIENDSYN
jgi:glycosyltransferase involved in cell wall biosynthesis